ncbi:gastrula zinc finger protein XlCGF8.2DB-like [Hippocampus zosterae]|uniref:gastrula zinc finger protein XlCGF8.2DB-like n=1 Tax=Hippocampus zosterae TaxID=109293 RepID=UPI00223D516C|nr:gastrula zinc finger protein XlCGF8.2DB-like [Hippocampus zosterae]
MASSHEDCERQRKQLEAVAESPIPIQGVRQSNDRQDGRSRLTKDEPLLRCVKEEEEEADVGAVPLTVVGVKVENDGKEPAERSRPRRGGQGAGDLLAPPSDEKVKEETPRSRADCKSVRIRSGCPDEETARVKRWAKKEKPFACPFCGKTFDRKEHVQAHVRIHTGEKPFRCSTCGKAFPHKETMTAHARSHAGENPFGCSICGKTYSRRTHVESHMRTHTGEKPFPCSLCGKSFTQKPNMVKHMRIHTGERPFACPFCHKAFLHKSHVESHVKIHIPFHSVCEQTFSQKQNLVSHARTHTGERPYSCSLCGGSYAQRKTLTAHMMRRHNRGKKTSGGTPPQ